MTSNAYVFDVAEHNSPKRYEIASIAIACRVCPDPSPDRDAMSESPMNAASIDLPGVTTIDSMIGSNIFAASLLYLRAYPIAGCNLERQNTGVKTSWFLPSMSATLKSITGKPPPPDRSP